MDVHGNPTQNNIKIIVTWVNCRIKIVWERLDKPSDDCNAILKNKVIVILIVWIYCNEWVPIATFRTHAWDESVPKAFIYTSLSIHTKCCAMSCTCFSIGWIPTYFAQRVAGSVLKGLGMFEWSERAWSNIMLSFKSLNTIHTFICYQYKMLKWHGQKWRRQVNSFSCLSFQFTSSKLTLIIANHYRYLLKLLHHAIACCEYSPLN